MTDHNTRGARRPLAAITITVAVLMALGRATWAAEADGFATVNLTPYYNNDGISSQANLDDGNFSEGILYPAESLPESEAVFLLDGIPFVFPPKEDDQLNDLSCRGQTIDLPDQPAAALYFLGASDGRLAPSQHHHTTVTLRYVDGVTESHQLWLTPWSDSEPQYGNRLAVRTEGFHVQNRVQVAGSRSVFLAGVYPKRTAALERIQLGHDEPIHIFALTLADDLAPDLVLTVDTLDWGAVRGGHVVAMAQVRALADVTGVHVQWTLADAEPFEDTLSLSGGQSQTLSFPYELEPGKECEIAVELSIGDKTLYAAQRRVETPPLLTVAMDRRLYWRQPAEQLAYWRFESPELLADEMGNFPLTASGAWQAAESYAGLNPLPGTGETNLNALNTRVPDHGTQYVCSGKNPLDMIGPDSFVVEGFGNGGSWGGNNRTVLDCRSPAGVGVLVNTTDRGKRYAATVQLSDGSRLSAHSDSVGHGDKWSYFAVVREKGALKFFVRGIEEGQRLTLVKTVTGVADDATVDTSGADWTFGGGPWYPSFDQYRVTKIPSDRTFTLLTGDKIFVQGLEVLTARIDAYVNVDAAELEGLSLVYELTDAEGNNPRPITTVENPSAAQMPYTLATQGKPDRTRGWPPGIYVPSFVPLSELSARKTVVLDEPPATEANDYRISARLLRGEKELARSQTKTFTSAEVDARPTRVVFDTDGTMRINDNSTFPVGIITGNLDPGVISELHSAGFNFVLPANPLSESYPIHRARSLLNQCHDQGLGVVLELKSVGHPLNLRRTVLTFRDHPAVLGWHLFEEPVYPQFTLDEIDTTWRMLKQIDPYHFFDVIDWSYSTLERYAPWSSVLIPDRYPIGPEPVVPLVRLIGQQVRTVRQAASTLRPIAPGGVKPVWTCLQTMTLKMGIDRAPTEAEIRAQTYESIVAGARGIMYFEYYWAKRSKTFEFVAKQVREVRELTPVLIDENPVRQAETEAPVDTWLKRHDGYDFLIAVNESEQRLDAKLNLPGASALGKIEVLFEKRSLPAQGGGFTDTFEPLGVHVYKILADTGREHIAKIYPVYPYGPMNRQDPGHVLELDDPHVALAVGELEGICLAVDNRDPGADTFDFHVDVKGLPPDKMRLARVAYLPARDPRGPHSAGDEVADALVPITRFDPVTVAAGECRHLWVTVDGRDLKPGDYNLNVALLPMTARRDRRQRATISSQLNVRVYPFEIPEKTPLDVYSWDQSTPLTSDVWMRNFVEHRMNVFAVRMDFFSKKLQVRLKPDGNLEKQPDFSDLTEMFLRGKPHGKFYIEFGGLGNDAVPCTDGSTIQNLSEPWKLGYKQWMVAFHDYLKGLGIGTDQWFFCPFDEAFFNGGEETTFVQAKLCYEVDPTIQFLQDTWPTKGPDQLARWRGVTNVTWCPDSGVFELAPWHWLRAENRPMWEYFCYQSQRKFEPHGLYRGAGPRAWHRQLDGTAFFAPVAHTGSDWNDLDGPFGDTCLVLDGSEGPINTRRWEAWREGIEDYVYIFLLDQVLKADGIGDEQVEVGRQLIDDFCDLHETQTDHSYLRDRRKGWRISAPDAGRMEQLRRRIGQILLELDAG